MRIVLWLLTKECRYLLANCPAGSHYNAENASCVKCPVGTYQPVQGQKECIPCGNDLTTASNGTIEESDCFGMFVALFNYLCFLITLYCNWNGLAVTMKRPCIAHFNSPCTAACHCFMLIILGRVPNVRPGGFRSVILKKKLAKTYHPNTYYFKVETNLTGQSFLNSKLFSLRRD